MPLLKKVFLALAAAVLTVLFVWYLWLPLHYAVLGMGSPVSVTLPLVGTPLLLAGFIAVMLRLGSDARRWGFEGYSPTFLFVTAFFAMLIRSFLVGRSTVDFQLYDTYFVFGGGHVERGVSFLAGLFAWAYYFYPRVLRRPLSRGLGFLHFWLTVVGMALFFILLERMVGSFGDFITWGAYSGVAMLVLGLAQVVFLFNLGYSAWRGKKSL